MATVHSKGTITTLNGDNFSQFANKITFSREREAKENTRFGAESKTYASGLKDATAKAEGFYDNAAGVNPRTVLQAALNSGVAVPLVYRPEGTGSGKPTSTVQVLVTKFEDEVEVDDLITWSAEFQFTGDITDATQ